MPSFGLLAGIPIGNLKGESRLPYPRFSGKEDEAPRSEPSTEDIIELRALELHFFFGNIRRRKS